MTAGDENFFVLSLFIFIYVYIYIDCDAPVKLGARFLQVEGPVNDGFTLR